MNTLWQTISIFISSTFRDMHSERDVLVKKVFPRIRERLMPYHIRLVDIDLRWGITAEQADNDKTIEFCLDSIEGCRPFFLGILGERYGWIPEKTPEEVASRFPNALADTGSSITAMEIMHGVLSPPDQKEKKSPLMKLASAFRDKSGQTSNALFFFRDPGFEDDLPDAFKPVMASEGPEHKQKLDQLKDQIRKAATKYPPVENYPCHFAGLSVDWDLLAEEAPESIVAFMNVHLSNNFLSPDAIVQASPEVIGWLQEHATVVLDHLDEFATNVEASLWTMLCDTIPELNEPPHQDMDPDTMEDAAHQSVVSELTELFLGREELRESFAAEPGGSVLVFSGPAGSGKSALMAQLAADWQEQHPNEKAIIHFTGATALGSKPDALFARLLRLVCTLSGQTVPEGSESGFAANVLRSAIEAIPPEKEILIALDGSDTLYGEDGFDLRWIPEEIPDGTTILLTLGEDQLHAETMMNQLSDLGAKFHRIPVMRREERAELIRLLPALWAKTMDEKQIQLLSDHPAANLPLYLTIALEELRKFGSYERLEKRISQFPTQTGEEGLVLLYDQMLHRLEREIGDEVVSKSLSLLALAETGLTEQELNKLCSNLEPEQLATLWRSLRVHLSNSMGLLGFYHNTLQRAIMKRYLDAPDTTKRYHRQLAAFFREHPDRERALLELLFHHKALEDWEEIRELLLQLPNLVLMRRKFSGELAAWWDLAQVADPLASLSEVLQNEVPEYADLLKPEDEIYLGFWTPASGTNEIVLYNEEQEIKVEPKLDPVRQDALMEVVRMIEESLLRNRITIPLSVKLLAVLEQEYGPVHSRTLEALATAIPLYFQYLDKDDAQLFLIRCLITATTYLTDNHPVAIRIRMHVQDFMREHGDDKSYVKDFDELMAMFDNPKPCEKLREVASDRALLEGQRMLLKAMLLTRHSQMLRLNGDIREAVEYCRKALEYSRKHLGPFHELSIQALNNLAMILINNEGDLASGEEMMKETIQLADSRIGKNSSLGLVLVNNLSTGLGNAGKYEEGLPWYIEAVERKKAVLGTMKPSTLHSIYNLAWCYHKLGNLDEAIRYCLEAADGFEKLGEGYENELLQIRFHLVEFLNDAGKPEEGEELLGSVIDDFSRLPEEKQEWLTFWLISGYLANMLEEQGHDEDLWKLWEDTLEKMMPHQAAKTQIQKLYNRMDHWLKTKLEAKTSEKDTSGMLLFATRLVKLHERLFGGQNESTLHWQVVRGDILNKLERFEEAESLLRTASEHLKAIRGEGDPETRIAISYLAQSLMGLGRDDEAGEMMMGSMEAGANRKTDTMTMMERFLKETEEKHGLDHPKTLQALDEIGQELWEKDRREDSLTYFEQAFERSERTLGPLDPKTLERGYYLAVCYHSLDRLDKAEPLLRQVARNTEKSRGSEDPETLKIHLKHADTLMALKEYPEAAAVMEKALPAIEKLHGTASEEAAGILGRLARAYEFSGDKDQAASWYARFSELLHQITNEVPMQELTVRYGSEARAELEERIRRGISTIQEMKRQGKMDWMGDDQEQQREMALTMTNGDVVPEHPEGSKEIERWVGILEWQDPTEDALKIWNAFCDQLEQNVGAADPVRYLPRLKFCEWLRRYEGYDYMVKPLGKIWQEGDINSFFVQQAARLMFDLMANRAPMEQAIEVGEQILEAMRRDLDVRNPALHWMMHDVARFLADKQQTEKAIALYDELIQAVGSNLKEDHSFMKQLVEERDRIDQDGKEV
jgi:tetratricopeptide (TPR) repeat protein